MGCWERRPAGCPLPGLRCLLSSSEVSHTPASAQASGSCYLHVFSSPDTTETAEAQRQQDSCPRRPRRGRKGSQAPRVSLLAADLQMVSRPQPCHSELPSFPPASNFSTNPSSCPPPGLCLQLPAPSVRPGNSFLACLREVGSCLHCVASLLWRLPTPSSSGTPLWSPGLRQG